MKPAESNSKKSVSYQKKDGPGHARQSIFWYDIGSGHSGTFERDTVPLWLCEVNTVVCIMHGRPNKQLYINPNGHL